VEIQVVDRDGDMAGFGRTIKGEKCWKKERHVRGNIQQRSCQEYMHRRELDEVQQAVSDYTWSC
jgi:hypothetical protein